MFQLLNHAIIQCNSPDHSSYFLFNYLSIPPLDQIEDPTSVIASPSRMILHDANVRVTLDHAKDGYIDWIGFVEES